MSEKEFDLKAQPYVELKIRFYRAFNQDEGRGVTCLKLASTDVSDRATKKRLGSLAASTDCTMVLADEAHGRYEEFMCSTTEVWNAFQEALAQKRCPECGMVFQHEGRCSRR